MIVTMTYLTVPIAAANADEAKSQIKTALTAGAEMLELRTDYLENLTVEMVVDLIAKAKSAYKKPIPIIVTCRDHAQGGANEYPENLRIEVLSAAIGAGAEFVDLEYENFFSIANQEKIRRALSQNPKSRLILSAHNFEGKFPNITKLYRHILTLYSAAIPKLVYTANHINDCFEAFDLLHQSSGERIILCMGRAGLISRIIAKKLGSLVTFASLDNESATAPGQITIEQLKKTFSSDSINSETVLYGVLGSMVYNSASPAAHNACFAKAELNKLYLPLLVEGGENEFDEFMRNVRVRSWLNFAGFSVTIPHKANALNYVRQSGGVVEPLTEKIGAANTLTLDTAQITNSGPQISAYNTDYIGAMDAIISKLKIDKSDLKDLSVAVLGAGGVARAIVAGLTDAGAKVCIYNRTVEKAEKLAEEFGCDFAGLKELESLDAKLVVNCTSIGMEPDVDATPLPQEYIKKDMTIFDTVYNPFETLLLKQAKEAGAKTIDGFTMFVEQAAEQFKLFTGSQTEPKLIEKTVIKQRSSK
ncbi:MAG: shikimate dehydrogenase [Planctomycetes bacterium]|nr:shikimate dehydrogenase [Planctomycetota bacterium]